jgi:hypothetical protein
MSLLRGGLPTALAGEGWLASDAGPEVSGIARHPRPSPQPIFYETPARRRQPLGERCANLASLFHLRTIPVPPRFGEEYVTFFALSEMMRDMDFET